MLSKTRFLLKSMGILINEYTKYLWSKDYNKFIKNISEKLAAQNIFYVKIFQALSTNCQLLTPELNDYLTKYTDHVPYTVEDMDLKFMEDIEEFSKKNPEEAIYITDKSPTNSGMIALIYEGYRQK